VDETVKEDSFDPHERAWEQGWQDHQRRQMKRLAQLPLSEKLVWLEEAHRLALHMGSEKLRIRTPDGDSSGG
jgi:hypothetical protein